MMAWMEMKMDWIELIDVWKVMLAYNENNILIKTSNILDVKMCTLFVWLVMTALKNTLVYHHKEAFHEKRLIPVTRDGKQHLRAHDSGNFPSRWQVHIGPCYRSATATYRYWSPEEEWLPSPMTGPGNTQFANFEDSWEDRWSGRRNEKATLEQHGVVRSPTKGRGHDHTWFGNLL